MKLEDYDWGAPIQLTKPQTIVKIVAADWAPEPKAAGFWRTLIDFFTPEKDLQRRRDEAWSKGMAQQAASAAIKEHNEQVRKEAIARDLREEAEQAAREKRIAENRARIKEREEMKKAQYQLAEESRQREREEQARQAREKEAERKRLLRLAEFERQETVKHYAENPNFGSF